MSPILRRALKSPNLGDTWRNISKANSRLAVVTEVTDEKVVLMTLDPRHINARPEPMKTLTPKGFHGAFNFTVRRDGEGWEGYMRRKGLTLVAVRHWPPGQEGWSRAIMVSRQDAAWD
jgi:hypothetical protein